MDADDLVSRRFSLKRPRSPSPTPVPSTPLSMLDGSNVQQPQQQQQPQRQPKRQRKTKTVPAYDEPPDEHVLSRMGKSNPLNRRVLKNERKKERKAMKQKMKLSKDGMEIDDFGGLEFTFMAT